MTADDHDSASLVQNVPEQEDVSEVLHDLTGPLVTASGFMGELQLARDCAVSLLKSLPADTDAELVRQLKDQVDTDMQHCLDRVNQSLSQLDTTIQRLRNSKRDGRTKGDNICTG
ncbi:MAG: hypothetical protein HKN42_01390 [Granulosicoccus sp.]|nr:hypothetical protein [Granulosicoccus sp.]